MYVLFTSTLYRLGAVWRGPSYFWNQIPHHIWPQFPKKLRQNLKDRGISSLGARHEGCLEGQCSSCRDVCLPGWTSAEVLLVLMDISIFGVGSYGTETMNVMVMLPDCQTQHAKECSSPAKLSVWHSTHMAEWEWRQWGLTCSHQGESWGLSAAGSGHCGLFSICFISICVPSHCFQILFIRE